MRKTSKMNDTGQPVSSSREREQEVLSQPRAPSEAAANTQPPAPGPSPQDDWTEASKRIAAYLVGVSAPRSVIEDFEKMVEQATCQQSRTNDDDKPHQQDTGTADAIRAIQEQVRAIGEKLEKRDDERKKERTSYANAAQLSAGAGTEP